MVGKITGRTNRPRFMSADQLRDWIRDQCYRKKQPDNIHNLKNPCLIWPGNTNSMGYGAIFYEGGKLSIHRFMLDLWPKDKDVTVMHLCDTPRCIEEEHLKVIDGRKENILDIVYKDRKIGRRKLSNMQVRTIRKMVNMPHLFDRKRIAKLYDVSANHISNIRAGRRRQYI